MKAINIFIGILILLLAGCKPQPPEVVIVPPTETPREVIDNYYYVKFQWGKNSLKDTITIEIPDDTIGSDSVPFVWDAEFDYMLSSWDMKHEKILDTTGWSAELEWEYYDEYKDLLEDDYPDFLEDALPIGYHYAPATFAYPRGIYDFLREDEDATFDEEFPLNVDFETDPEAELTRDQEYYKNIFGLIFPWNIQGDTGGFWDIQDYLDNPSAIPGTINWGRVGSEEWAYKPDTFLMWNSDAYSGVVISFTDEQHVEWRSDNHPTFQDGSYFVINKRILNQRDGLTYYIIEGEFSVKLYNPNEEYKQAKGGTFRLPVLADVELEPQPE